MIAIGSPLFKHKIAYFKGETVQPSFFKLPNTYECSDTEYQLTFSAARLRHLFLLKASFCFLDLKAAGVNIWGTQPPHCTRPAPTAMSLVLLVSLSFSYS